MFRCLFKYSFLVAFILLWISQNAFSQLYAPARNWVSATQYVAADQQDSVFLYFSSSSNPVLGKLRAQFSDSSASTYTWYKYYENLPVSQRFQEMQGVNDSLITNVDRGGYKVKVTRIVDDSTQFYTAWMMIDDVEIVSLDMWDKRCERLILEMKTLPLNSWDISQLFTYFDLSLPTHQEKSVLATGGYFRNNQFSSNNVPVESVIPTLSSSPFIYIEFQSDLNGRIHGPLKDATYTITVNNPFGGSNLVATTPTIGAISTKSDFEIYFNKSDDVLPNWEVQSGNNPNGEALLEMKLESKAENADSIFWRIINDPFLFLRGGDSIVWRDSSLFEISAESLPPKERMVPGFYNIEHISLKMPAGCRDTLYKIVEVDTSFIKLDAIPNVFSPNGDGMNDFFVLKDAETSVMSIKMFQITIFSRWGNKVYEYSGDPKVWEGWNGKINNTNGDASPGVYYFVIDAIGWDGKRFRGGQYKGFLHLFR